jgi:hypothetical protein
MKRLNIAPLALGLAVASVMGLSTAQMPTGTVSAGATPMKMTHAEFLRMYTWDPANEMWIMNAGVTLPEGVKSRANVKAERDAFLRNNRYDNINSKWIALGPKPREVSAMTREEVRAETIAYMRTHEWDETTEMWVEKNSVYRK